VSELPWMRPLPESWPLVKLKYICNFIGGGTPDTGNAEYWGGQIPWVSPKDMKAGFIADTEDHLTEAGIASSPCKVVGPGAVLIVMRSGILRHSIPVAINKLAVALNQDMRAIIPDERLNARYLARLFEGHQAELLHAWGKEGATVESLDSELLDAAPIPIPPTPDQINIAVYLDQETARIDLLTVAKERLLLLLGEKRQAIVAHAVTRGINPSAPLRGSGVSWLGEIPAHWKLIALRFLVDVSSGATPDTSKPEYWGGEIPWVSPKDMKRDEIADAEDHLTELALSASTLQIVAPGAVLIVVRGMILMHSFPTAVTIAPVTINQDMKALRCGPELDPVFLRDFFRGIEKHLVSLADQSAHGTRKLETEVLGRLQVCLPPIDEQRAIVSQIAAETATIDALRCATERTISLLRERRAALIAAAVTGQVEIPATVDAAEA